jgi:hypothetical protein
MSEFGHCVEVVDRSIEADLADGAEGPADTNIGPISSQKSADRLCQSATTSASTAEPMVDSMMHVMRNRWVFASRLELP